jgi:epoxyqueuosine reductase
MNYFTPEPPPPPDGAVRGRIARYARGRDYHNLIPKRLRSFDAALAAEGGRQRCFVDSGPLLERDFAVLAGIAWHGKSTLALHPKLGTWFLLAAVITTLEIEPDTPMAGHCGKCTRCIDACPTSAIVAPHLVDARRCLSYWTIEHEGPLPDWIRPLLGDRIFGCDDCLDACPWNRFAVASREASFAVRPSSQWPLRDYLALDEAGFRKLFEGSPIRRAGRQGFLRNVCTALGNVGTAADLSALERSCGDTDPIVAEHAAWAVQQLESRGIARVTFETRES